MKITYYNKFNCIADQCTFTCCEGWDIALDSEACWQRAKEGKKYSKESKRCPFLKEDGLCHIVEQDGELALPESCHTFPRLVHEYEGETEELLSFACPVVLDIVKENLELASRPQEPDNTELTIDSYIRHSMLEILDSEDYELSVKLLLIYQYLSLAADCSEDDIEWETESFLEEDGMEDAAAIWEYADISRDDTVGECVELFLDIMEDYKEVPLYKTIFEDLIAYVEKESEKSLPVGFELFHGVFSSFEPLLQIVYRDKIYESCRNEDIEDTMVNYQLLAIEYAMVRIASFLKWKMSPRKVLPYEDVRNYVVAFSRIIGHNSETFVEFIEDSFENTIVEAGYLALILL